MLRKFLIGFGVFIAIVWAINNTAQAENIVEGGMNKLSGVLVELTNGR